MSTTIELNPLAVLGLQKTEKCLPHFSVFHAAAPIINVDKMIRIAAWCKKNCYYRYYIQDYSWKKITVALEDPEEYTLFSIIVDSI